MERHEKKFDGIIVTDDEQSMANKIKASRLAFKQAISEQSPVVEVQ
jgi:hypothetical protein